MKKFAMLLMNPLFVPETHHAFFQTGEIGNYILTVRNEAEAEEKISELAKDGFGVLEVCGAFEAGFVQRLRNQFAGKLCIGRVEYPPEQEEALKHYWEE